MRQKAAEFIVEKSAYMITNTHLSYTGLKVHFVGYRTVNHSKTYVYSGVICISFAESYHTPRKCSFVVLFKYVSEQHLHGYLCAFEGRWSTCDQNVGENAVNALKTVIGKR